MATQRAALYEPVPVEARRFPFIAQILSYFPHLNGRFAVGTGTLIGPRVVLTAGHVVFDGLKGGYASAWRVTLGGADEHIMQATVARTTRQWMRNDAYAAPENAESAFDFGVVVLPDPVDVAISPVPLETMRSEVLRSRMLNVAGFPAAQYSRGQLYGTKSVPVAVKKSRIFYPISTKRGMSGGPVYDSVKPSGAAAPERTLRAIHTSFSRGYGCGLRITPSVLQLVRKWLTEFAPS